MSTLKPAAFLLHSVAVALMTYAWFGLDSLSNGGQIAKQKGGRFQYLTMQGLLVAWLTMALGLLADLLPGIQLIRSFKRAVFMVSMPIAATITIIYWALIILMPRLILRAPETSKLDPTSAAGATNLLRIPLSLDLSLHAFPGIALLLDFLLFEKKYSKRQARQEGAVVIVAAFLWYSCWVEHCASYNGIFPYPILTSSPFHTRVAIYAGTTVFAFTMFQLLNRIHS